jgi:hypothetical protein
MLDSTFAEDVTSSIVSLNDDPAWVTKWSHSESPTTN